MHALIYVVFWFLELNIKRISRKQTRLCFILHIELYNLTCSDIWHLFQISGSSNKRDVPFFTGLN